MDGDRASTGVAGRPAAGRAEPDVLSGSDATGSGRAPRLTLRPVDGDDGNGGDVVARDAVADDGADAIGDDGGDAGTDPGPPAGPGPQKPARPTMGQRRRARRIARAERPVGGPWVIVTVILVLFGLGFGALALTGKPVRLPVWLVAEAEARLNRVMADLPMAQGLAAGRAGGGAAALSIGGAVLFIDRGDWTPRLLLEDLRLLQPGGSAVLSLPEARFAVDPAALVRGQVRLTSVRLVGGRMVLRRLPDGRFDLAFGGQMPALTFDTLAGLLDAADAAFGSAALASLDRIEAEALTLTLQDQRAGRTWDMGDGRLTVERRADGLAAELALSLVGGASTPAQARLTVVTEAQGSAARIGVAVDRVAAADIALQAPGLAWLGVLEAEVSGDFAAEFNAAGEVAGLEATLALGAGALRPAEGAPPVPFSRVALSFGFDPLRERVTLRELAVDSATLRLAATGHADLPGVRRGLPDTAIAQIAVRQMRFDPEGLFEAPAEFSGGAVDLRLRLRPFSVEIGQATLLDGDRTLTAKGRIQALAEGWSVAVDVALDAIGHDRLVALWPLQAVPRTRAWAVRNFQEGTLLNVKAALRSAPGTEPKLALTYDFSGAGVRFMPTLPPVEGGHGYAVLEGLRYTVVLDDGHVTAPAGGALDVSGSVFVVPDVTEVPATGEITLQSRGSLTATLALLDQPPFGFISKAGQRVDLGAGQVTAGATLRLPLIGKAQPSQIEWRVAGRIADFRSDVLVPGRTLTAPALTVTADKGALVIAGAGQLQGVPFDATYRQPLGAGGNGGARVTGTVEMSQGAAGRLRLGLPERLMSGTATGEIDVTLARGRPPELRLTLGLQGLGLSIPELGWSKARAARGTLAVAATLSTPAAITDLSLKAEGLEARGTVSLRGDGSLDQFRLSRLRVGSWLDATARLTGQGAGRTPRVALTGGTLDIRRLPGGGQGGGGPLSLSLDRVVLSDTITLTGVAADLTTRGGIAGPFAGQVNGGAEVRGSLRPAQGGTAISLTGSDAGSVLSSAGIFPNARGGTLEMTAVPRGSGYTGRAVVRNVRVRNTPVLAELVNAISVVGLLEQLDGGGLVFSEADADFRLTPDAVEITQGAAVGASLGVSLAGLYDLRRGRLDMQGVISPIYLVNGIGAIFTRRGEGLFGFNYRLRGTPSDPQVTVNPLSVFTPGMFREIFRRPAPRIGEAG
ncbi:MAG: AsmA-like C-terminal region-containing protein [Gemmobacter sp.]